LWVPLVKETDALLVNGGDSLYLCHWMRESGLADLLPSLETVWVGLSAGSMVMTPRIGEDFVIWTPPDGGDAALGLVEFSIVLRGEPTLRTHESEQQLRQGDVVAFPRGKEGAHQIRNDTDAPVRVLMLSTLIAPDIVEYLDTGKIGARSVAGERIIFARPGPELEYWEDED